LIVILDGSEYIYIYMIHGYILCVSIVIFSLII